MNVNVLFEQQLEDAGKCGTRFETLQSLNYRQMRVAQST